MFKSGCIVVHGMDLMPSFGFITEILVFNVDEYYLVTEFLHTKSFSNHYHAYEVTHHDTPMYDVSRVNGFMEHTVLGIHKEQSSLYIPMKYHIVENI